MRDPAARRAALGRDAAVMKQVHGTAVHVLRGPVPREGDGLVSDVPGSCIGVYVADCQPILMWDLRGMAVGAIHAGWRSTAAGIARAAVEAMGRLGAAPDALAAAIGPHARACCYEVGPEVAERFHPESLRGGCLDLAAETCRQLAESGVRPENISVSDACTMCRPQDFFSYRREGRPDGMLAFIEVPG